MEPRNILVIHRRDGETVFLTVTQFARFFDNRDPRDWIV